MTILVTGATGNVGRTVVDQLVQRGADVRALVRDPAKAHFPDGVEIAQGDLLDVDALRAAFSGVSTLFLLNGVVADEFTQALVTLQVAREAGIERIVYLSVIHADLYVNVPHFAGKFGVERMIEQMGMGATILRPAYFMDNEVTIRDAIAGYGLYPMPLGAKGIAMIDARDIGEIAAIELIRREEARHAVAHDPDQPRRSRHADRRKRRRDLVRRAGPEDRLSRRGLRGVRAEPAAVHAVLDGARHAPDGGTLRLRRHGARGGRCRSAGGNAGPPPAPLPRLRRPDRGPRLLRSHNGGATPPRHQGTEPMIHSTATLPVNPDGEAPLTRDQVWAGLGLKARDARAFLPAGLCTRCDVTEETPTHFVRDATIGGKDLREIIVLEPGRKVTFFQATGPREGAIVNEIVEDDAGALHLRFYCYLGLRDGVPDGPEERAEQARFDSDDGYRAALASTLARTRALVADGRL